MPIVDGKYEAKISTTYASPKEGIDEIKRMIQKSRRIRISNIPMPLLNELLPILKDKVNFASRSFSIIWIGDKILGVSAMEYGKCAKCLMESFEGNWHYAQKW